MSYDFVTLDPNRIVAIALATTSMPGSGQCLGFADICAEHPTSRLRSGSGDPNAPADGNWMEAQDGWWYTRPEFLHPGDGSDAVPGGFMVYSQMIGGDPAGHIAPIVDRGTVRTTTGTRVVTQSIAELNAQRPSIRRDGTSSVLGWISAYGNNPISGLTALIERTDDDEMLSPDAQAFIKTENDRVINAQRREARARLYHDKGGKEVVAINWHALHCIRYKSQEALQQDVDDQIAASVPGQSASGFVPEQFKERDRAALDALIARCATVEYK